jgi:HAE1 family hydrophobic/amphiphilic exporter-1
MNISEPFIRRPVMTTILVVAVLLFGMMAYRQLPVSDLPNVDYPTIQVSAGVPGASAQTMAATVALPLERQFSTIAGIDTMSSASVQGNSQISIQFSLERDIDACAQDIQAAISRTLRRLPDEMPAPPSYSKSNPADDPILFIALTSPTLPLSALNDYGESMISPKLSMVNGVAQVAVYGGQKYAVRIFLDPERMAARGIGIDEVELAVQGQNVNQPAGILYGPHKALTIEANGQLQEAAEFRKIVVAYRDGAPVRLGDLGEVKDSVENDKVAAWYCTPTNQQRSIMLAVQRQPGVNTVKVAESVKAVLPAIREQLPASVSMHVMIDNSVPIKASADDAQFTLLLTFVLVVLVIFLFLRNLSATAIPSMALPMSIIGTFAVMYLLDYSLDNLSLMALTLAIGFVVDDAIVMLENIVRHREKGVGRLDAALVGSKEVAFTIVSMTISLAAVFIPVMFLGGIVGRIFREFAVTIGAAVLISGVVSLSLTPMLCSKFLGESRGAHHGHIYLATERGFDAMKLFYDRTLRWALRHRRSMMVTSLLMLVATVFLFGFVPKGFIPSEDRGIIRIRAEAVEGISFDAMVEQQKQLAAVMQKNPNIEAFMSSCGARGSSGGNSGNMFCKLKPRSERKLSADEVIQELRKELSVVPGIRAFPGNPPVIRLGSRSGKADYQFTLQCTDTDDLYKYAGLMESELRAMPELQDVGSDVQLKNPTLKVNINRDKAASMGLSIAQIETALYGAYGSREVSTMYMANDQYSVIMGLMPEFQRSAEALSLLYLRSTSGELVPLKAVADVTETVGPLAVNHSGQLPSATLFFNLKSGVPLGQAVDKITKRSREVVPASVVTSFQGTAQAFQDSIKGLTVLLVLAIVVIYMVLAILYENFYHPITILSALPFAGVGALLALMLFRAELSMYAFVGIIMLVGLVKKNGIMMIDFALEAKKQGVTSPEEAIHQACLIRFRPIMMTTMAALMAGIPIAMGYGAGGEARQPLGLAVVGGLIFSQTLTLYVTPVFYVYIEKFQDWIHARRAQVREAR